MQLDVDALIARDPAVLREVYEVCRTCARVGAYASGARGFADDITQDLMQLILGDWLRSYDRERDIEPFLKECARRMGKAYLRRHSREVLAPPSFGDEDGWDPMSLVEAEGERVEELALEDEEDRLAQEARETLKARLRARRAAAEAASAEDDQETRAAIRVTVAVTSEGPPAAPVRRTRATAGARCLDREPPSDSAPAVRPGPSDPMRDVRRKRPAVQQLQAVRKRLGLTQAEMARALGLLDNSIRSIEYGVVAGEPETLLRQALELEKRYKQIDADLPGDALIKRWCTELGIAEGDTIELANVLGLHRSTIFRWSKGKTQPAPHKVRLLNGIVEALKVGV